MAEKTSGAAADRGGGSKGLMKVDGMESENQVNTIKIVDFLSHWLEFEAVISSGSLEGTVDGKKSGNGINWKGLACFNVYHSMFQHFMTFFSWIFQMCTLTGRGDVKSYLRKTLCLSG